MTINHKDPTATVLWHGGAPGRHIGDLLLPPTCTGLAQTSGADSLAAGLGAIAYRPDRVYLTSRRDLAEAYAGMWLNVRTRTRGGGVLYRVEADTLEPDADVLSLPGLSFQTTHATVLEPVRSVPHDPARIAAVLMRVVDDLDQAKRRRSGS